MCTGLLLIILMSCKSDKLKKKLLMKCKDLTDDIN